MSPRASQISATYQAARVERHQRTPERTREDRQLDDLRQVIHILAMAMTEGKAVA